MNRPVKPATSFTVHPSSRLTGEISLDHGALDALMPMHLVVGASGEILASGRTIRRLMNDCTAEPPNLFQLFEIRRPRGGRTLGDLLQAEGGRLSLASRQPPRLHLKGVMTPLDGGRIGFLNLSFGFSVVDAVREFELTAADFAGTDLAVEMLYLVEAKSAALLESKKLNLRLQGAKVAAEEQAFTDTLTGLKNRRALDHILSRLAAEDSDFSLLHIDLDYFKQVNDTHGHAAGDEVLQAVARVLVGETRAGDTVARVGGDEFVLVFRGLTDEGVLRAVARRIIDRLEQPVRFGDALLHVSGSAGLVIRTRGDSRGIEALQMAADDALYGSKRRGRGRVTVGPPFHSGQEAGSAVETTCGSVPVERRKQRSASPPFFDDDTAG